MVDSSTEKQDVLSRIAEDNDFFKRMLSLLPPLGLPEQINEQNEDETMTAAEKRKLKRKEKRAKRKRDRENNVEAKDDRPQMPAVKHKMNNSVAFTAVKPKKAKLVQGESSESETDNEERPPAVVPTLSSTKTHSPKHNIPSKHKLHNHGNLKTSEKENDSVGMDASKSSNSVQENASKVVSLSAMSPETDSFLTASISSIEDKRAKLREKIEQLKAKRNPTNRERLDRKKLKRQESKMKLKQKRKLEKLQAKQNKQNGESSKPNKGNMNKGGTPVKPVFNKEGQMVFSKFDFTDSGKKEKLQTDLHGKDYKRLLEKIEKRNEKINKVKSKDESAGKALEDKFKWESVMHKAEGEKVKDNPELLKKSLKRKQKIKDQKKKKWDKRVEQVEKMKDERQKKRNENIQKRKQAVKDKKMQKLKKKGRIIPGF